MSIITIKKILDLEIILESPLFITGDKNLQEQEMLKNMWVLSLDHDLQKALKIDDLIQFIIKLLENKNKQLKQLGIVCPVIFYMWFDEMAAQLRFNIISDFNDELPFECKISIISDPISILENFLYSFYHEGITWEELEELESEFDEDQTEFILDVFAVKLNN